MKKVCWTAWAAGHTGAGQMVAILDTGVALGHAYFQGKIVEEACFSTSISAIGAFSLCPNGQNTQLGNGAATPCSGVSNCDHGTHVAGIAVGNGDNAVPATASASPNTPTCWPSRFSRGSTTRVSAEAPRPASLRSRRT